MLKIEQTKQKEKQLSIVDELQVPSDGDFRERISFQSRTGFWKNLLTESVFKNMWVHPSGKMSFELEQPTKEAAVIYRSKFGSACDELKLWGVKPMYMGTL